MTELTEEEKQRLLDLKSQVGSGQRNESGVSPEIRAEVVDLAKRAAGACREIIEEHKWDKEPEFGHFAYELLDLEGFANTAEQSRDPNTLEFYLLGKTLFSINFDTVDLAKEINRLHPELYVPLGDPRRGRYIEGFGGMHKKLRSEVIISFAEKVGFLKPDESITTGHDRIRFWGVPSTNELVRGSINHGFIEIPHPDPNKPFVLSINLLDLPIDYKDRQDYTLGKDFFAKGRVAVEWDERRIKVER